MTDTVAGREPANQRYLRPDTALVHITDRGAGVQHAQRTVVDAGQRHGLRGGQFGEPVRRGLMTTMLQFAGQRQERLHITASAQSQNQNTHE